MNTVKIAIIAALSLFMLALAVVIGYMILTPRSGAIDVVIDDMRVIIPAGRGRLPVVILAHNGGQTKDDWGDFPESLAASGYAVINIGWTDFKGSDDLKKGIETALSRCESRINPKRAAFIGGCHGGIKMLSALESRLPVTVKALVFLSMSELYSAPSGHAPILGIYSLRDHLGEGYVNTQKKVYSSVLSDPKTVIALDATPHGNELVVDASTRERVRSEILTWLYRYL
jgi:dienelactone hydrolase